MQRLIDGIIDDLMALEAPILGFFEDVDQLRQNRLPEANEFYQQCVISQNDSELEVIEFKHVFSCHAVFSAVVFKGVRSTLSKSQVFWVGLSLFS